MVPKMFEYARDLRGLFLPFHSTEPLNIVYSTVFYTAMAMGHNGFGPLWWYRGLMTGK